MTAYDRRRLFAAYSSFLESQVQPNVAVTATLCQSRSYWADTGRFWRPGDAETYRGLFDGLVCRLSRAVYGRRAFDHGHRVPAAGSIEGDGISQLFHIHALMRRPNWMAPETFDTRLREVWLASPWLKPDLRVEEIQGGGWVPYVTKGGPEGLLFPLPSPR